MTGRRVPAYVASVTPKGRPRAKDERTVKTTVDLPEALWKAAKIRALDERKDLRAVIVEALTAHLEAKRKKGSL